MYPPFLPAAPWTASQAPGSQTIGTPDGYFTLDLEGLDTNSPVRTAAALRQAVAALPDCLAALQNAANVLADLQRRPLPPQALPDALLAIRAALTKAGFTANQYPHHLFHKITLAFKSTSPIIHPPP